MVQCIICKKEIGLFEKHEVTPCCSKPWHELCKNTSHDYSFGCPACKKSYGAPHFVTINAGELAAANDFKLRASHFATIDPETRAVAAIADDFELRARHLYKDM